jgi:hypothetical protein
MNEVSSADTSAIPRLQPGTLVGGGVPPSSALPPEWAAIVLAVQKALETPGEPTDCNTA